MESKKRSYLKSFSFVTFHVTIATLIFSTAIFLITGKWEYEYFKPISLAFLAYLGWELVSYYWHERLWNIIPKLRRIK
jgi:sterol desaturase/sphingolipid hydroxylase (fatty acid hydroxylase superfamily)